MSYNNGRLYKTSTQGLSISDISHVLGVASNDLGTLCKHDNINKWAKYKPVSFKQITPMTDTQRKSSTNWGLSTVVSSSLGNYNTSGNFLYRLFRGDLPWNYIKPSGGENSPYRISDFLKYENGNVVNNVGYNHNCVGLITTLKDEQTRLDSTSSVTYSVDINGPDSENLSVADFQFNGVNASSMHLSLFMVKGSATKTVTSADTIGEGGGISIKITGADLVGTWKVVPFLSDTQKNIYVSLDVSKPVSFTVGAYGSQYVIHWNLKFDQSTKKVTGTVQIENKESAGNANFGTLTVMAKQTSGSTNPSSVNAITGTSSTLANNVTLAGYGKTPEYPVNITLSSWSATSSYNFWICLTSNSMTLDDSSNYYLNAIEDSGDDLA